MPLPIWLRTSQSLPELRIALSKVSPLAAHFLTKVWAHQLETGEGILEGRLFHNEKPEAFDLVAELCPFFLVKDNFLDRHRYRITLLGAFCAQDGEDEARLLVRSLEFMKKRYANGNLEKPILSPELGAALELDENQAHRAACLIYMGGFCRAGYGGVSKNNGFALGLPPFMHQLQHESDLAWIVEAKALEALKEPVEAIEEGIRMSPAITQTQHCEVWGIGHPGDIFKRGRPFHQLWEEHRNLNKTAALPLADVCRLLRNYWSRKGEMKRAPSNEDAVLDLYSKKNFY